MRQITVIFSLVFFLSGCTSLVNSVVKEPINPDPTSTTIGSDINDLKMDTFIGVNIKKASPALKKSHINVHVYDSVVLLTGEVRNKDLKILQGRPPTPIPACAWFTTNSLFALTLQLFRVLMTRLLLRR